jgi:hypothetical protein
MTLHTVGLNQSFGGILTGLPRRKKKFPTVNLWFDHPGRHERNERALHVSVFFQSINFLFHPNSPENAGTIAIIEAMVRMDIGPMVRVKAGALPGVRPDIKGRTRSVRVVRDHP